MVQQYWSVPALAKRLGMASITTRRTFGKMKGVVRVGEFERARLLIPEACVQEWLKKNEKKPKRHARPRPTRTAGGEA